jgi:hypothetical protein
MARSNAKMATKQTPGHKLQSAETSARRQPSRFIMVFPTYFLVCRNTGVKAALRLKHRIILRSFLLNVARVLERRSSSINWSASIAGNRCACRSRFTSTSSRTTSAKTSLQTLAAQSDRVALSSPQGDTIPPVRTLESRKSRIRRLLVTSRDGFDHGAGERLPNASFRKGVRKRD